MTLRFRRGVVYWGMPKRPKYINCSDCEERVSVARMGYVPVRCKPCRLKKNQRKYRATAKYREVRRKRDRKRRACPEYLAEKSAMQRRRKNEKKEILAIYQGGCCLACDIELPINLLEMAHDIARSLGGGAGIKNVFCLLCSACNRKQGTRSLLEAFPERASYIERMRCLAIDQLLSPDDLVEAGWERVSHSL